MNSYSNCCEIFPLIHDWLEGLAKPEEILIVQLHLERCPSCNRIILEWQVIAHDIAAVLPMSPTPRFDNLLRERLNFFIKEPKFELIFSWLLTSCAAAFIPIYFEKSPISFISLSLSWLFSLPSWLKLPLQWISDGLQIIPNIL